MTRYFKLFLILSVFAAVVLVMFPAIDLHISAIFYDTQRGFFLNRKLIPRALQQSVQYVTVALFVAYGVLFVLNWVHKNPWPQLTNRVLLYLVLVLAIGPGLLVNTIFKNHWGRARPLQTSYFGGDKDFTPAFVISDQCPHNCSFPAGDPSVGFYFLAWGLVASGRRRKQCMILGLGLGAVWGINRIIQGAHFFSDVVFSGVFVYLVAYVLYQLLIEWPTVNAPDPPTSE